MRTSSLKDKLPKSAVARMVIGGLFVVGGTLGFLPILGFWMLPLGVVILSIDLPGARRFRRRMEVRYGRWRRKRARAKNRDN